MEPIERKIARIQPAVREKELSLSSIKIESTINEVREWIKETGETLLALNNQIPNSLLEATELRKKHEEIELKCTDSIAAYKELSELPRTSNEEDPLGILDLEVQEFLGRLHIRRSIVVSCHSFYRLIHELCLAIDSASKLFTSTRQIDSKFHKECHQHLETLEIIKNSLQNEHRRLIYLLDTALPIHYEVMMQKYLLELENLERMIHLKDFDLQRGVQLDVCKEEVENRTSWIAGLTVILNTSYLNHCVGKTSQETKDLLQELCGLQENAKMAYKSALENVNRFRKMLSQENEEKNANFKRSEALIEPLENVWKSFHQQYSELKERREVALAVYNNIDSTLFQVDDLLQRIHKQVAKWNFEHLHSPLLEPFILERDNLLEDYKRIEKVSLALMKRLTIGLTRKKDSVVEKEENVLTIKSLIQQKVYNLWTKITEVNKLIEELKDSGIMNEFSEQLRDDMNYWRTVPIPRSLSEIIEILKIHLEHLKSITTEWDKTVEKIKDNHLGCVIRDRIKREIKQWTKYWQEQQERLIYRQNILTLLSSWEEEISIPRSLALSHVLDATEWNNIESLSKWTAKVHEWYQDMPNLNHQLDTIHLTIANEPHHVNIKETIEGGVDDCNCDDDFVHDEVVQESRSVWQEYQKRLQQLVYMLEEMYEIHNDILPRMKIYPNELSIEPKTEEEEQAILDLEDRLNAVDLDSLIEASRELYGDTKPLDKILEQLTLPKKHASLQNRRQRHFSTEATICLESNKTNATECQQQQQQQQQFAFSCQQGLQDQTVSFGSEAIFTISFKNAKNLKQAQIQWLKDDEPIDNKNENEKNNQVDKYFTTVEQTECKLLIRDVNPCDTGRYSFRVDCDAGHINSEATLALLPPFPLAPTFVKNFGSHVECLMDDTVMFIALVQSFPKPTAVWLFNDTFEITNQPGRYQLEVEEIKETAWKFKLVVKRITLKEAGRYSLKISNLLGEISCFGTLSVLPPSENGKKKTGIIANCH